jgi:hypothetical protein
MVEAERIIGIGSAEEQADFIKRHDLFMKRFPNLRGAFNTAFARGFSSAAPTDRVVFSFGQLCVEDLMEILVLAGNGYGIGALKILRGMFEKAITAHFVHEEPQETENFLDYYWVTQHKLAQRVNETFGEEVLPKDKVEETRQMYAQVKHRFMVKRCKDCGTTQLNHTWSKLDFVSMAKVAGILGNFIVPAYYLPLQHKHATVRSILSRLEAVDDGRFALTSRPQRNEADDALRLGHLIVLNVLLLQKEHFKLAALNEALDTCYSDYMATWHPN